MICSKTILKKNEIVKFTETNAKKHNRSMIIIPEYRKMLY